MILKALIVAIASFSITPMAALAEEPNCSQSEDDQSVDPVKTASYMKFVDRQIEIFDKRNIHVPGNAARWLERGATRIYDASTFGVDCDASNFGIEVADRMFDASVMARDVGMRSGIVRARENNQYYYTYWRANYGFTARLIANRDSKLFSLNQKRAIKRAGALVKRKLAKRHQIEF